ncbi:MarR family winged helix-turn-helix transcriptional regulator [Halarcobacter bivalviorum]|uniref:HTH-type transcriptional regulator SarZ n=1 Tax=Halarcobacter bivalviorum TaxID=663364 RepID=A0AAX2A8L6_9BACT|nr:MarR family transcriptional regulator [Halarcobacter bivalviorum]AXH12648.1 transcriptional regulator, MarR family [Halarcobacter bivalviorum]RXK10428.1 MarR family transcriptional regulator [Halarcobacter bivalviorum]
MDIKQFETNLKNIKEQTPQVFKESMNVTIPFFILHRKLFEHGDRLLKEKFSLNQSELDILSSLFYMTNNTHTMSPTELYEVMVFSSGGMTKILKKLESKKYIKRVENSLDKRSKLVQLTNLGKEITVKAISEIISFEDNYFSKLKKEEQELFTKLILKVLN